MKKSSRRGFVSQGGPKVKLRRSILINKNQRFLIDINSRLNLIQKTILLDRGSINSQNIMETYDLSLGVVRTVGIIISIKKEWIYFIQKNQWY